MSLQALITKTVDMLTTRIDVNKSFIVILLVNYLVYPLGIISLFSLVIQIESLTALLSFYIRAYGTTFDIFNYKATLVYESQLKNSDKNPADPDREKSAMQ